MWNFPKRRALIGAVCAVVGMGAVACGGGSPSGGAAANASSGAGSGQNKNITVGMSVNGAAIPFYEILRQSAEDTAKQQGVHLIVSTPTTVQDQNSSIQNLLAQNVDALIVAPLDAQAVVPAVQQANKANVPVITVDENAAGGHVYTYIASPNQTGGELAGKWIVQNMPNGGTLGVVPGSNGDTTSNERTAGLMGVLKDHPDIKVVTSSPGNWVTDEAFRVASNMLTSHHNIDMIFALNDGMAMGAVQAVNSVYKKSIPVIGYNGDPIAITAIKGGKLDATVAQDPKKMAQLAIQYAIDAHQGKPSPGGKVDVPIHVVDKSNIAQYAG